MNISLTGPPGAGKDFIANHLVEMDYCRVSFAYPLYDAVACLLGAGTTPEEVEAIKDGRDGPEAAERIRRLLQVIGKEGLRDAYGGTVLLDRARWLIDGLQGPFVITDTRFLDEVAMLRERGFLMVYVTCPDEYLKPFTPHSSESLTPDQFDLVVNNDRTKTGRELVEGILGGSA